MDLEIAINNFMNTLAVVQKSSNTAENMNIIIIIIIVIIIVFIIATLFGNKK